MTDIPEQLDTCLKAQDISAFPGHGNINYYRRFESVAEWLNNNVHPHVEKGVLLREDGFLTDHGPEHVKTVIRRASALVAASMLSPYETYLLLTAIHFHDVGNLYGRKGHEKKLADIMDELGHLLSDDAVEKRAIQQIAGAHGGTIGGDKDTISRLPTSEPVLGQHIRKQLLAAILRFADELADDSKRAARVAVELGVVPVGSEIFHAYAGHLHSVMPMPERQAVELRFQLNKSDAVRRFGKLKTSVYLLDEIYERTVKTHLERMYCMRFMASVVTVNSINVNVEVFLSDRHPTPIHTIGYRLAGCGKRAFCSKTEGVHKALLSSEE